MFLNWNTVLLRRLKGMFSVSNVNWIKRTSIWKWEWCVCVCVCVCVCGVLGVSGRVGWQNKNGEDNSEKKCSQNFIPQRISETAVSKFNEFSCPWLTGLFSSILYIYVEQNIPHNFSLFSSLKSKIPVLFVISLNIYVIWLLLSNQSTDILI